MPRCIGNELIRKNHSFILKKNVQSKLILLPKKLAKKCLKSKPFMLFRHF